MSSQSKRCVAFLFPGQGSQKVGMGRTLYDQFPYVAEIFEAADDALGYRISQICFAGPEDELVRTKNTQPAILTVSVAAAEVLKREAGLSPALLVGHSLGEYSALVCGGSLLLTDAVKLVHKRGLFMQEAVPEGLGAMAAVVGLSADEISALCAAVSTNDSACQPANFNGAGQVVLSGHKDAVERALPLCKQKGAKLVKLLPVSAPFHSALMAPAATRLQAELDKVIVTAPKTTVIANVDAKPYPTTGGASDGDAVRDRLYRQVAGTVRFEESIGTLLSLGMTHAIEVGPGKVLSGLVKRIAPSVTLASFGEPSDLPALESILVGG